MNSRELIMTRTVNFIVDPMRTSDTEVIRIGARGTCRVHLILYGETS